MKRIPLSGKAIMYFERLDVDALEREIQRVIETPVEHFSLTKDAQGGSHILRRFHVVTEEEVIEFDRAEAPDFFARLRTNDWSHALIKVGHGYITANLGFVLPPTDVDEYVNIFIDNNDGSLEIACRLQNVRLNQQFFGGLVASLKLSEKPIKHSRRIPQELETRLLCDAMHVCSVCKEEGVQIHHIKPVEEGGLTVEENLIVVCLKHHRMAHTKSDLSKKLTEAHLREYKRRHLEWVASRGVSDFNQDIELG
jgi:hypothetical protein